MADTGRQPPRREEYAHPTRQAIIDAARKLFAERGYFATKVDDIAGEARVAPATVYAVTGAKRGLLEELIRIWTTDPIVEATITHIGASSAIRPRSSASSLPAPAKCARSSPMSCGYC